MTRRSTITQTDSELARLLPLLGVLIAVYILMVALSAIDWGDGFWKVSQWKLRQPIFIVAPAQGGGFEFNANNQTAILEQGAINIILSVGMTFVILTAGIDLSVGSLLALCNVLFVITAAGLAGTEGAPGPLAWLLATAVCLGGGAFCGWLNGAITVWGRVQSFIVTLGMFLIARGVAYLACGGQQKVLFAGTTIRRALPIALVIIVVAAAWFILRHTRLGRYMYAVGGNLEASRLSGVPVNRVRILAFTISGLCAALAGIVYWSRVSIGTYLAGEAYELYAIAAVVIGGTSLMGGRGSVIGTLIGALIMAVLSNGLNTVGIDQKAQQIIIGMVIVAAALFDSMRRRTQA